MDPFDYTEPETDKEVIEVLELWATKLKKPGIHAIKGKDITAWSEAQAAHGTEWCRQAIKRGGSIFAGVVICDAEKNMTMPKKKVEWKCSVCSKPTFRQYNNIPYCTEHHPLTPKPEEQSNGKTLRERFGLPAFLQRATNGSKI